MSVRWRYLLLGITILAAVAGLLLTQQVRHLTAPSAADAHSAIPLLIDDAASADTSDTTSRAIPPDGEPGPSPAGAIHLQLCLAALAGALGLFLKFSAHRTPLRCDTNTGPPSRTTGTGASTSERPPTPVLSSTCVLRV